MWRLGTSHGSRCLIKDDLFVLGDSYAERLGTSIWDSMCAVLNGTSSRICLAVDDCRGSVCSRLTTVANCPSLLLCISSEREIEREREHIDSALEGQRLVDSGLE